MKALVLRGFGGLEHLQVEDWPVPELEPGEALVRVHACAVSPMMDVGLREGRASFPDLTLPHIPGIDPAGQVVAVGDGVEGLAPGDRVVATPWLHCGACNACREGRENSCRSRRYMGIHRPGGHAQYATVPARSLVPLPDGVSYQQAAATPVALAVAWHLIATRARITPADRVLVQGAAGGAGSAAVQVCKLLGARVIASVGNDEKARAASDLGADRVVNYRSQDLKAEVTDWTDGQGVEAAFDAVGPATFDLSLACLAPDGRLLTVGGSSGTTVQLHLPSLYRKHLSILSSSNATQAELRHVLSLIAQGAVRPLVHATYPLGQAAEAHRVLAERRNIGVVVLNPQQV